MQNRKINLKERWSLFFNLLFDPWVLILLLIIVTIFYFKSQNKDSSLDLFYTVFLSIIASVWGGIVSNRWISITEQQAIAARGKGAIQSLQLLLSTISNIKERIFKFKNCCDAQSLNKELLKSNFEEIEFCMNTITEVGYSSIETWQDILPEADLKEHFKKDSRN
ncbi:MAG: hypothetical protein IPL31_04905 [Saprospiraceae bacterium]|nr:hypothetical protein [Saprospiraceae bacterium]